MVAPLYQRLRRASAKAASALHRKYGWDVPPLRATAHVGEDYRHLTEGLRRIWEVITFTPLDHHDRLGHAVALAICPHAWTARLGTIETRKEVRLWDLLFEWKVARGRSAQRDRYVEEQLTRLSREVFDSPRGRSPEALWALYEALHEPATLPRLRYSAPLPSLPPAGDDHKQDHELFDYLRDRRIFLRGAASERVCLAENDELEAIEACQQVVRSLVRLRSLVVEVNPSSNLLIGDLRSLHDHPLWRLDPPEETTDRIPITICADDPITFATSLPEEFVHLRRAMLDAGLSEGTTREWLRRVCKTSLEARFTLSLGADLPLEASESRRYRRVLDDLAARWLPGLNARELLDQGRHDR